jgi:hypothetical protein
METRLAVIFVRTAEVSLACALLLFVAFRGHAQGTTQLPPFPSDINEEPKVFDHYPTNPSLKPAFRVPVGPLGFSPPGSFYLLRQQALVSLDFFDENRLLFTFHKKALEVREFPNNESTKERQIRAVVIELPGGTIKAEAQWTVPDQKRYLWMLKGGHFLLRDADGLEQGDAGLQTIPSLRLPGHLLWVELDPAQKIMITNSLEAGAALEPQGKAGSLAMAANQQKAGVQQTLVVRTIVRQSGEVIHTMRAPWTAQKRDWPANAEGYVESGQVSGTQWSLKLNLFAGGSQAVGLVDSICQPATAFVTETELAVSACNLGGGGKFIALSTDNGIKHWQVTTATNSILPLVVAAPDGSRVARETLLLKRPAARYKHQKLVGAEDLMGQVVRVMDTADGKVAFEAPLTPILDGGGNVTISPSGRRVAILNDGAIEVFELPAARVP